MNSFRTSLLLSNLIALLGCLSVPAFAQGVSEYGGAMGASSATTAAAHRGAQSHANSLQKLYGNPLGVLGDGDQPAGKSGKAPDDTAGLVQQKYDVLGDPIPVDPRVTVANVGKTANKLYAQGQAKEKAGQFKEAESFYMRSINLRSRFWGDKDPAVIKMYVVVGDLEMKMKHPTQAEPFYRRALQANLKKYGFGSYENVDSLEALGNVLYAQNKCTDAANYYRQVMELRERKFGPVNDSTIDAAQKLADAYANNPEGGWLTDAVDVLKKTIPHAEKLDNKAKLAGLLTTYSGVLRKQGKTEEADKIAARLSEIQPAAPVAPAPDAAPKLEAPADPSKSAPPVKSDAKSVKTDAVAGSAKEQSVVKASAEDSKSEKKQATK